MASIEKRQTSKGATVYIVKWREPNGKHRTKGGFTTKKAAEAYATKAEAAKLASNAFDPNAGKVLFRDVAQAWLNSRHDLKETTRAAYADALAPTPASGQRTKRHARLVELRIDTVFGDYPMNAIRREHVSDWLGRMKKAGKSHSTIRNALFLVRMVLRYAADEKWIPSNPAADVKLPRSTSVGEPGVVDDPAQDLTAAQVAALAEATPWPYNVLVQLAAWSGLRAGELAGLQVGDVELPAPSINPNVATKRGGVHVTRTLARVGAELRYLPPKTKGSRRRVPLTAATTALLRDHLATHPRGDEPTAPLFPSVALARSRPTGVTSPGGASAAKQAAALAELTTSEAGERLVLDWTKPYRHATFYKAVFRLR